MRTASIILLFGLLLSSCSLQKRKYLKGFYLDKASNIKHSRQTLSSIETKNLKEFPLIKKTNITEFSYFKETNNPTSKETVCDTLYMSNGVKMIVKVSNVDKEKIHYYLCDSENQAEFHIETSKIKKVCYANGLTDELKNPKDAPYDYAAPQNQFNPQSNTKSAELEAAKRKANNSLGLVLSGFFFFPIMIAGFIMAHNAKRKLKNQRGYESSYRLANTISIIGYVFLGLFAFIIFLTLFLAFL